MAAPPSINTLDLSGKWLMNKTLSGDTDPILAHQGIGYLKRTAIGYSSVTLVIKHSKDDAGIEHIEVDQILTGGISGVKEIRHLDWSEHETSDHIYGPLITKSRRFNVEEHDIAFLKEGWLPDTLEHRAINGYAKSDTAKSGTTWSAEQVWGFEEIEVEPGKKERRYVRHINFIAPDEENIQVKLVYDYLGPA